MPPEGVSATKRHQAPMRPMPVWLPGLGWGEGGETCIHLGELPPLPEGQKKGDFFRAEEPYLHLEKSLFRGFYWGICWKRNFELGGDDNHRRPIVAAHHSSNQSGDFLERSWRYEKKPLVILLND